MTKPTAERIIVYTLFAILIVATGFAYSQLTKDRKANQESFQKNTDQVGMLQTKLATFETKLTALEKTAVTLCYARLDMVWENNIRRDPYYFANDTCGPDGYRCLSRGGDISPSCYNKTQCASACTGHCVSISEMKTLCK